MAQAKAPSFILLISLKKEGATEQTIELYLLFLKLVMSLVKIHANFSYNTYKPPKLACMTCYFATYFT